MKRLAFLLVAILTTTVLAEDGARLLIITTDALYNSILPLAQWKHATGLSTRVVKLSTIGSDTGSIHSYIRNAYNNWPVRPEYILLVGSQSSLPAVYYRTMPYDYATDNNYGDVTGDFRAELPVGRFPARTAAQLDVMVAKTLAYERYPDLTDTLWMRRLVTIVREGGDSDDTVYWNDARYAASLARTAGWVSCDSFSNYRGHSASYVVSAINAGRGIVLYRGSAVGNWYDPFAVNPASTSNGTKLPVILSATCATMTLTPNESMVGEAWLKAGTVSALKGAVAFIGNTHSDNNVARVRGAIARGFFTGLFSEGILPLGKLLLRAKQQLYTEFPSRTNDYRGFNLLGDPSLRVWTKTPERPSVSHPPTLLPGLQRVDIVVTAAGIARESALACLSMASDTTVYSYGYTDSLGVIKLQVTLPDTGRVRLVVTGPNLCPYDTTLPITATAVNAPPQPRPIGVGCLMANPTTFEQTVTLRWSSVLDPSPTVRVCDATGNVVRTLIPARSNEVIWDGRTETGTQAPAGTYVCMLETRDRTAPLTARVVKLK